MRQNLVQANRSSEYNLREILLSSWLLYSSHEGSGIVRKDSPFQDHCRLTMRSMKMTPRPPLFEGACKGVPLQDEMTILCLGRTFFFPSLKEDT
jgi:hypothetical protein